MRPLVLAVLALGIFAPPASGAVLRIEFEDCACDPSSGDVGSTTLVVRAAPGELNRLMVEGTPGGSVLVSDAGAALRGCRPVGSGARRCDGVDGVEVQLGDGDDTLDLHGIDAGVDPGPGDDSVLVSGPGVYYTGSPGADLLDLAADATAVVWYGDRTEGVTIRMNGLADDGGPGEGDDLRGRIISMTGGSGDDALEAGTDRTFLIGGPGNDTLVGGPVGDDVRAGEGNDRIEAGAGDDMLEPGPGSDVLIGGAGSDFAGYGHLGRPAMLRIGDGPADPAAGDGDDVFDSIESLGGGESDDTIIGDDGPNLLSGGAGRDTIMGGPGDDRIYGGLEYRFERDVLDPGSGRDRVSASAGDEVLLVDGEADRLGCRGAPDISADPVDVIRTCAPSVLMRLGRRPDSRGRFRVAVRCDDESAVDCAGHVVMLRRGRPGSTQARFGPIAPGEREVVRLRLLRPRLPAGRCLNARAVTRRDDVETSTSSRAWRFVCGPRPSLG